MLLTSLLLTSFAAQLPADWRLIEIPGVERVCDLSGTEGFTAQTKSGEALMIAPDGTVLKRGRVPESRELRGGRKDAFLWDLTRNSGEGQQWRYFELMNLFGAAVFLGPGSAATILTSHGNLAVPGIVDNYSCVGLDGEHRRSVTLSLPTSFLLVWESKVNDGTKNIWITERTPITALGKIGSTRDAFAPLTIPGFNDVRLLRGGLVAFIGRLATLPRDAASAVHERLAELPLVEVMAVGKGESFGYLFVMDPTSGQTIAVARANVEVAHHLVLPRTGTLSSDTSGSNLFIQHVNGVVVVPTRDLKRRFEQVNQ